MNTEMLNTCNWVLEAARKAGAKECKAALSRTRSVDIEYREKKPETIKEATTQSLGVEIFVDGRYSSQNTSDLRKESLQSFIAGAIENTRLLEEDPYRRLPDPKYYEGRSEIDLKSADPAYDLYTADQRHELAREIEAASLDRGGDKVISATASVGDEMDERVLVASNGLEVYSKSTSCYAGAEVTVQDEGDRRPQGYHFVGCRTRAALPAGTEIGKKAAECTLQLMGARKIETETLPIIIENQNVARVLSGFMQGLYGYNIQQKRSFLADKKGVKVGSDLFTLIDEPHIVAALGSKLYDGDGFPTRKRTIVEAGTVKEFLVDWYYSRKLGWEPTTGSTSNLVIPPGQRSVEEIMKDLGRGIYITGFIGGNSNSTTGDTSVGIFGHLFENGLLTQPIAEMNIADNHLKFWNKLTEAANDPWTYSNWRMPSLVFADVVVSGV